MTQDRSNMPTTPLSFSFVNTTTGVKNPSTFTVGDEYQINITGPTGATVSVTAIHNGGAPSTSALGQIGGQFGAGGAFVYAGVLGEGDIGTWSEVWSVNGSSWNVSFSVGKPKQDTTQAQNSTTSSSPVYNTPINTTNAGATPVTPPAATDTFFSDLGTGLSYLLQPSQWGMVFQSGNIGEIVGLVGLPVIVLGMYWQRKVRR